MLIYDDIYHWKGWGGKLRLGSGKCRLRIYDLNKTRSKDLAHLRPIIVVITDIPESNMSIRSCASHIATLVAAEFNIDPHRMLWVEYYPEITYGTPKAHVIPERFEAVEFTWHEDKAIKPVWRNLQPAIQNTVKKLIEN